jgi:hypothetical protein
MTSVVDAVVAIAPRDPPQGRHQRLVEKAIDRLPLRAQTAVRWLLKPSSRWLRIPAGVLLVFGGLLSILPLFGLWMLPLGLVLLAEDVPPLKRARNWVLDFVHRHRPHWFEAKRPKPD